MQGTATYTAGQDLVRVEGRCASCGSRDAFLENPSNLEVGPNHLFRAWEVENHAEDLGRRDPRDRRTCRIHQTWADYAHLHSTDHLHPIATTAK